MPKRNGGDGMDMAGDAWQHQGGSVARVFECGMEWIGARRSRPTAAAGGGVSSTRDRREMRPCGVAARDGTWRGKSRGARVVVRRKGKLTGGTRLSVTLGSERARERGSGPAGLAGPRCSRPARLVGASACGACATRSAAAGFGPERGKG